ncbi:uroporphyrinogen-III synthase [Marivita sp. GX14005]|uniref:uroporphyrinogen-III synthase n=1 Tax=Marivita sp. GX14005 TaxID=2942276 RepID=UPI002018943F|nr:uroporphyrinogen-III synthase [Marivita sp. GX14005]MCL3881582.1 uroporphyrinogen-III synthase [Marivita sp. GX14005]
MADCLVNPLLSIRVTGPLPSLHGIAGLIFTSSNAIDAFRRLGGQPSDISTIAVGEGTASAVRAFGFRVATAGGTADAVVKHVLSQRYGGPLLHLRGETAIGDIAQRLTAEGVPTREAVLYDQVLQPLSKATREALSQDRPIVAPVFSPRTAMQLVRESKDLRNMRFAAISPAVAEVLGEGRARTVEVADTPNRQAMLDLVANMVSRAGEPARRF